jgi:hypothetical protein
MLLQDARKTNITYPKVRVSYINGSALDNQTLVFQIKFFGKGTTLLLAASLHYLAKLIVLPIAAVNGLKEMVGRIYEFSLPVAFFG